MRIKVDGDEECSNPKTRTAFYTFLAKLVVHLGPDMP